MFGGLSFLLDRRMCCGIIGDDLVVRVTPDQMEAALARRHVRPMDFTGRPMRGFVASAGCRTAPALKTWIGESLRFVEQTKRTRRRAR